MIELGAELMICGRRAQVLENTAKEFEGLFPCKVRTHVVDIRSAEAVEALMDVAFDGGPLHVLVNNAAGNFILALRRSPIVQSILSSTSCCTALPIARSPPASVGSPKASAVLSLISSFPMPGPVRHM